MRQIEQELKSDGTLALKCKNMIGFPSQPKTTMTMMKVIHLIHHVFHVNHVIDEWVK